MVEIEDELQWKGKRNESWLLLNTSSILIPLYIVFCRLKYNIFVSNIYVLFYQSLLSIIFVVLIGNIEVKNKRDSNETFTNLKICLLGLLRTSFSQKFLLGLGRMSWERETRCGLIIPCCSSYFLLN